MKKEQIYIWDGLVLFKIFVESLILHENRNEISPDYTGNVEMTVDFVIG